MRILAKFGYEVDEQSYVCELSFEEMCLLCGSKPEEGAIVEIPNIGALRDEARLALGKLTKVLRLAQRSESLLQSLNSELGAARLEVNDKKAPDLSVVRAHIAYLKSLNEDAVSNA